MVLSVADEDTYRLVRKRGLRLQGRRYEVETYEEVRPDVECATSQGGATLGYNAPEPLRDAGGARRSTRRETTDAL